MGNVNRRDNFGECVYCGHTARLTRDHIPPKCLFASAKESDLIKVPSCSICNGSASKDDEYFRLRVALRADVFGEPDVGGILPAIHRSLEREKAAGFRAAFFSSIEEVKATTPAGVYVGKRFAYNVDLDRLCRVPTRIVRGLFWQQRGARLTDDYRIVTYALSAFHGAPDALAELQVRLIAPLLTTEAINVGRAFSYWVKFVEEDPAASAWMMRFYQRAIFLSMILPGVAG
jgi:hypothetical protein